MCSFTMIVLLLTADAQFYDIRLIPFLLDGLVSDRAQCLFVRILRNLVMTPNHLVPRYDPH